MGRMTGCERSASRKQKKAMNTHETAAACAAAFIASLLDRSSAAEWLSPLRLSAELRGLTTRCYSRRASLGGPSRGRHGNVRVAPERRAGPL